MFLSSAAAFSDHQGQNVLLGVSQLPLLSLELRLQPRVLGGQGFHLCPQDILLTSQVLDDVHQLQRNKEL